MTSTEYTAGPIGCTVYLDGTRMADGRPGDHDTDVAVLDDLAVTWGRSTTVDQPEPTGLRMRVLDPSGSVAWRDTIRQGAKLEVYADAEISGDPVLNVATDPDFTGSAPRRVYATEGITATVTGGVVVVSVGSGAIGTVYLPPAPFADHGTLPSAWDAVPTSTAGERWGFGIDAAQGAPATRYRVSPVGFDGPWVSAARTLAAAPPAAGSNGTTAWRSLNGVTRPPSGLWIGVAVGVAFPVWANAIGSIASAVGTIADQGVLRLDRLRVLQPPSGTVRQVLVAAVEVQSADASYDVGMGGVVVDVSGLDFTADLGNRAVGDVPWPAESVAVRASRIIRASGTAPNLIVDPLLATRQVSRVDVDRQYAAPLLQNLATTVDGVLWPAAHATTGPYLWLEDPAGRLPLSKLAKPALIVIVPSTTLNPATSTTVPACELDLESAQWQLTHDAIATRVAVTWLDQSTTPDPTEKTWTLIDRDLERTIGSRDTSVTTQLTSEAAASAMAARILARLAPDGWRMRGLVWETADTDLTDAPLLDSILTLLDGTTRIGRPVQITDLPEWTPLPGTRVAYLEGGSVDFAGGYWSLDLTVVSPTAIGQSVTWQQIPAGWLINDLDPTIRISDLNGVSAP